MPTCRARHDVSAKTPPTPPKSPTQRQDVGCRLSRDGRARYIGMYLNRRSKVQQVQANTAGTWGQHQHHAKATRSDVVPISASGQRRGTWACTNHSLARRSARQPQKSKKTIDRCRRPRLLRLRRRWVLPLTSTQIVTKRTAHSHPYNLWGDKFCNESGNGESFQCKWCGFSKLVLHRPNEPKHTLLKSRAEASRFAPPQYQTTTCNVIRNCAIATMPRNRRA